MRKMTLAFFAFFTVTVFQACNSEDSTTSTENPFSVDSTSTEKGNISWISSVLDKSCTSGVGMGNFILSDGDALLMRNHFDKTYGKYPSGGADINAVQRVYWINACTISSIAAYLNKSKNADGIRIHFAAANSPTPGYGHPYTNQTTIYIYPTVVSKFAGKHNDLFVEIPAESGCSALSYIKPYASTKTQIEKFDQMYHLNSPAPAPSDNSKYSLSKSVWIDTCVINFMDGLIKKSEGELDGIRVYTAAYIGSETRRPMGAVATQASTIIMIPTSPLGSGHQDRPDVITQAKAAYNKGTKSINEALNHGELCPNACGETDL